MALEEARAEVKRLKTEMYVMELQKKTKKVSPNQLLHKDTATKNETQKFASYKDFVSTNKKREAGFQHFKVTPFSQGSTPAKGAASDSD
jgi:hypothetical protein